MNPPLAVWVLIAAAGFGLAVAGGRGLIAIHSDFAEGALRRLDPPLHWTAVRGLGAFLAAVPLAALAQPLGSARWAAAAIAAALVFAAAPALLAAARERLRRALCDELPLHLDLVALVVEGGGSVAGALAVCMERAPPGVLRRAWKRVALDLHSGMTPPEAFRALEERCGMRLFGSLVPAMRSAERFGMPLSTLFRDAARQAAARRFARAEHLARTAPLKLWATCMLCLVPCTAIVLAVPAARLLGALAGE